MDEPSDDKLCAIVLAESRVSPSKIILKIPLFDYPAHMCEFDPFRQKHGVKFRKVLPGLDKTETFSTHRLTMGLPARMTIHCRFSTYRDVVRATGKSSRAKYRLSP